MQALNMSNTTFVGLGYIHSRQKQIVEVNHFNKISAFKCICVKFVKKLQIIEFMLKRKNNFITHNNKEKIK